MNRFIVVTTPSCRKCKDLESQNEEFDLGMRFVGYRDPEIASFISELGIAQAGAIIDTEKKALASLDDVFEVKNNK